MGGWWQVPRADEPRVPVRLSHSDYALIEAAATSVNVAVAALMRECSVRYAGAVAREVAAGNITLRRQRVAAAIAATDGQVRVAAELAESKRLGLERQARVNALASPKPAGRSFGKARRAGGGS